MHKKMKMLAVAGAVALGVSSVMNVAIGQNARAQTSGFLPYTDSEAVARGADIYGDYCASCHGAALEGEENWRDRDADGYLPAPPHDASGHTWHHPDAQLFMITKFGTEAIVGNGYRSRMAGYGEVLSDEEIAEVLAYIKSTWPARVIDIHNARNDAAAQSN